MKFLGQFQTQINYRLFSRKPLFLWRAGWHFANNLLKLKSTSLRTMDVMINTECTCRCEHCFAESFNDVDHTRQKLSLDEMKSALTECVDNGVFHFSLQGGEPFLHPGLNDIIKACQPKKSYITIVSNGTVAAESRLKEVYNLFVDKIVISLDSFFPEEHDSFRKLQGCYQSAIQTLIVARKIGLDVSIAVTVLNENLHTPSIQKLLEYAAENQINVEINIPQPLGRWDGRTDLILTEENAKYLEELHRKNIRIRRDLYYHLGTSGCPAVKEAMYLNIYGDVFPCVFIQLAIGNLRQNRLKDIRLNALAVKEFSEYWPKCLASEDKPFLEKYISQGFGVPKPADGIKIFNLKELPQRK